MITGYNTDVKHNDLVFHVQTEDKGTGNPFIETLIYVGGQVLAAKRTSYAELLQNGADKQAVGQVMDRQHRTMIAAIKGDRYQDKIRELFGTSEEAAEPEAAVESAAEASAGLAERTLDEVILEYLTTEAQQDHLVLSVEEDVELVFGSSATVVIRASSSRSGHAVAGALVTVKMISTADRPRILSSGTTDEDGFVELELEIPEVVEGTSALIITADSVIGKAELKYLL